MRYIFSAILLAICSACTTPQTMLTNDKTGETFICGGHNERSIMLGAIGYYSQKSEDAECVTRHVESGFKRVAIE